MKFIRQCIAALRGDQLKAYVEALEESARARDELSKAIQEALERRGD